MTTPPPKESEHVLTTPPSYYGEDSLADYPAKDHPEAPLGLEDGSVVPPADKSKCIPREDPFSRFWSGHMDDTSDKDKRRHRWLIRKPEHRHSINTAELERQIPKPHRLKFYSKYPDAKGVSIEYMGFILQHIVQQ